MGILGFVPAANVPQTAEIYKAHAVPFTDDGRIVMFRTRRSGRLAITGGRREEGETVVEGVRREVFEESGVIIEETLHSLGYLEYEEPTNHYHPIYVARVEKFGNLPDGTESAARIVFSIDTVISELIDEPEHRWKDLGIDIMRHSVAKIRTLIS